MKLQAEFFRLPLRFDVERLASEIAVFSESDWMAHPMHYQGNSAIPLISVNGQYNDDFVGPMSMTPALKACPYIQQVLASFNSVFGRSRLMRLGGGCEVPAHADITYHWYNRVRIHVPIITTPEVQFFCNKQSVHMAPGEAWIFDSWKVHKVVNPTDKARVHLVVDTAGSADFWEMVERSERPLDPGFTGFDEPRLVPFAANAKPVVLTEKHNAHVVMSPGEVDALIVDLNADLAASSDSDPAAVEVFIRATNRFRWEWQKNWYLHGTGSAGWPHYRGLIQQVLAAVAPHEDRLLLSSNRAEAVTTLKSRVLSVAFHPEYASGAPALGSAASPQQPSAAKPAAPAEPAKIGRNQPCPCGSGKKYKYCHG